MRALAIVHQRDAGPGVFADAIVDSGAELDTWMISGGGPPPRDPAAYDAVLAFGGAMHADQEDLHPWLRDEKELLADLVAARKPLMCVCLGAQLLADATGGAVCRARQPEIGWHEVELSDAGKGDPVLGCLPRRFTAFGWHSYETTLPPGAVELARNSLCLQAFRFGEHAWAIQFHAEVSAEDLTAWIESYTTDPDAIRIGLDPRSLAAESAGKIKEWNRTGRALCAGFCEVAVAVAAGATPRA